MERLSTYTFLEEYQQCIQPAIADVDVFLRTTASDVPMCAADVACVLDICEEEVKNILREVGTQTIDKEVFFAIMRRGSSKICRLYAREIEAGSPIIYNAPQIAYIYNLDADLVKNACQKLQIKEVTTFTMPLVFAQIPVKV